MLDYCCHTMVNVIFKHAHLLFISVNITLALAQTLCTDLIIMFGIINEDYVVFYYALKVSSFLDNWFVSDFATSRRCSCYTTS
jgi:hypothetical protein